MFDFIYETEVPVPVGTKTLALWLPYPASDEHQKIEGLSIQADYPTDVRKEPKGRRQNKFPFSRRSDGVVPFG